MPNNQNWDTQLEAFLRKFADQTVAEVHPKRSLDEILAEAAALLGPKTTSVDEKAARLAKMRENLKKSSGEEIGKAKAEEKKKRGKVPRVMKFNEEFEGMTEDEKKAAEEEKKKKEIGELLW